MRVVSAVTSDQRAGQERQDCLVWDKVIVIVCVFFSLRKQQIPEQIRLLVRIARYEPGSTRFYLPIKLKLFHISFILKAWFEEKVFILG